MSTSVVKQQNRATGEISRTDKKTKERSLSREVEWTILSGPWLRPPQEHMCTMISFSISCRHDTGALDHGNRSSGKKSNDSQHVYFHPLGVFDRTTRSLVRYSKSGERALQRCPDRRSKNKGTVESHALEYSSPTVYDITARFPQMRSRTIDAAVEFGLPIR